MAEQGFTLTSPVFVPDGPMPPELTCDGRNASPELEWMHPPEGTRSFALIVDAPDAPKGTFTHWVLFDIPADARNLPADADGIGVGGRNDFHHDRYGGPCPPPNHGKHRYVFQRYALDAAALGVGPGSPREEIERAMEGHVLGCARLVGQFERTTG